MRPTHLPRPLSDQHHPVGGTRLRCSIPIVVHNGEISFYDAKLPLHRDVFGYSADLLTDTEVITHIIDYSGFASSA